MQGQTVLCRGCVLLAKRRLPAEQRTLLLAKAAKAVEVAFRAYGRTARSRAETPRPTEGPMLQLLQFEVGVHRDDPSTRVWLQRAAETEGLTAEHVDWMGVICLQQHKPELGRLAFDLALKRRQAQVPKDYDQIAWLLRQLISTCTHHTRHEAKRYFEAARDELERFSPANCPMSEDDLHWSATHSHQPALSGRRLSSPHPEAELSPRPSSRLTSRPVQVRDARVEPRSRLLRRA